MLDKENELEGYEWESQLPNNPPGDSFYHGLYNKATGLREALVSKTQGGFLMDTTFAYRPVFRTLEQAVAYATAEIKKRNEGG